MRRRRLLELAGVAGLCGLSGCTAGYAGTSDAQDAAESAETGPAESAESPAPASAPVPELPVSDDELRTMVSRDYIAAITDPAFAPDWSELDVPDDAELSGLVEDTAVVGVERGGRARAYPLAVLDWHEVVNDVFDGPLLVTYCPLCGAAVVAERIVAGTATQFGVSGKLYRGDLVLYDAATGSLWSQLLATAIQGPQTGDTLQIVPSRLTSWGEWRRTHPDTAVLVPPPRSNTVRGRDPTAQYFDSKYNYERREQLIGDGESGGDDRKLTPRTLVVGISHGDVTRAYPYPIVRAAGVVNDRVGGLPVVVTVTPDGGLAAYGRRVGGRTRTFAPAGETQLAAAGSRFDRTTGRGVAGSYAGATLQVVHDVPPLFWTGWRSFHPDTEVYRG